MRLPKELVPADKSEMAALFEFLSRHLDDADEEDADDEDKVTYYLFSD